MAATTEPTVEAHSAGNDSNASKKKKAKKVVADNTKYLGVEQVMPVQIKSSHAKGRHIVAAKDIPAGTLVAVEKASGAIVRNTSFINICHHCFSPVSMKNETRPKVDAEGNEIKGQLEKFTVPRHSCAECKMAAYCSEECQKAHKLEHDAQCKALGESNRIASAHEVSLETLRGVLALLGRRAVDIANSSNGIVFAADDSAAEPTPYDNVLDLNANRHYIDRSSIKSLQAALKELLAQVPETAKVPLSEAVELACIFNSNQHQLVINNHHVLGVFPFSSLYFHHSCSPNCVYIGEQNGVLFIRALADIAANTDLTISYVELYQPREQRRRELLLSRHFWCKCRRCSTLLSKSVDRFMDGIQCTECKKGVMIFEETKEVQDINELMTDISALDQEIQGKFAECETCPAKIEVTRLVDVLKAAITDYGAAHVALQQGDASKARHLLEKFIRDYEDTHILHPLNAYLVNSYVTLIRTCTHLNDIDRAIKYNSIVLERIQGAEGAVPENYPRLAEFNVSLGDMCLKQAKRKSANRTPAGRSITRRYLKEARAALESGLRSRSVIYGEDSPRAYEAKKMLEDAKKEYDENFKVEKKKKKPAAAPAAAEEQEEESAAAASA
ncbi:SET domain-containing protein [Martensiomyces pterosporus]|nr:SET domain-containing protein [Martensiomyces pterosporus]